MAIPPKWKGTWTSNLHCLFEFHLDYVKFWGMRIQGGGQFENLIFATYPKPYGLLTGNLSLAVVFMKCDYPSFKSFISIKIVTKFHVIATTPKRQSAWAWYIHGIVMHSYCNKSAHLDVRNPCHLCAYNRKLRFKEHINKDFLGILIWSQHNANGITNQCHK